MIDKLLYLTYNYIGMAHTTKARVARRPYEISSAFMRQRISLLQEGKVARYSTEGKADTFIVRADSTRAQEVRESQKTKPHATLTYPEFMYEQVRYLHYLTTIAELQS
jgi:hypothetical protein